MKQIIKKKDIIPFAVVGSDQTVSVDGKNVPGRKLGWGVINSTFFFSSFVSISNK